MREFLKDYTPLVWITLAVCVFIFIGWMLCWFHSKAVKKRAAEDEAIRRWLLERERCI